MFGLKQTTKIAGARLHARPPYSLGAYTVEYLVIAGGGSSGKGDGGLGACGGGGAGGYRNSTVGETTGGGGGAESILVLGAGNYAITVGAGGAGATTVGKAQLVQTAFSQL